MQKNRNSNFEVLRIISIIMIIMHHYAIYSGFEWNKQITANRMIINFLQMFGKLGVCLFIIISGYFYDKSKFKIKKFVTLVLQTFIYAIIGLVIGIITNSEKLNMDNIMKSFLPITLGLYWFANCYILIYIFAPFIRKIIENISKEDFKILLTLMIIIWGIFSNIPKTKFFFNEFIWLIVIYLIGAYIKKYNINFMKTNKNRICIITMIIIVMNTLMLIMEILSIKISISTKTIYYFNNINSPLILMLTILIFETFKNINMKKSKIINEIAQTTFGIYLIHENIFLRDIIWKNLIQGSKYVNSTLLIANAICGIFGVFLISMIIDFIIDKLLVNNIIKIISKIYFRIVQNNYCSKLKNKIICFYNK